MEVSTYQETCCKCGIAFWITQDFHDQLVKCKNIFYCPNGHGQHYMGETDAQKLERYKQYLKNAEYDRDAERRSKAALKGIITRMKKKEQSND